MTATAAIEATGLVKTFGQLRAVDGIDLHVGQGEIFGVLGPNGAGKTTALRMLATLLPIDAGQVRVFGVDVTREPHRIRQLIGDRQSSMEVIVARAMARGELGPRTPPARVISLPVDLLRHELLMTLEPVAPEVITAIVDEVFLPLARVSSGLPDH